MMLRDTFESPHLIELPKLGSVEIGYLSVVQQNEQVPFQIKRAYWSYSTPETVTRGNHAHRELRQLIVAVSGTIDMTTEDLDGRKNTFKLNHPAMGLLIPPWHWRSIRMSNSGVLLCLASEVYEKSDYIYEYEDFLKVQAEHKRKKS